MTWPGENIITIMQTAQTYGNFGCITRQNQVYRKTCLWSFSVIFMWYHQWHLDKGSHEKIYSTLDWKGHFLNLDLEIWDSETPSVLVHFGDFCIFTQIREVKLQSTLDRYLDLKQINNVITENHCSTWEDKLLKPKSRLLWWFPLCISSGTNFSRTDNLQHTKIIFTQPLPS